MTQIGSKNHKAKLNEDSVIEIRRIHIKGVRGFGYASLAKKFGISETEVRAIINRKRWKHVTT